MKNFRVRRESGKIYILEEVEDVYGVSADQYIPIGDKFILEYIEEKKAAGFKVYLSIDKHEIGYEESKYRNIPTTDVNRVRILKDARARLETISDGIEMIDYIRYIDENNELNSRGFFITDNNREEKFLEILELGDDALIDTLESFLILKDNLSVLKSAKSTYDSVYEKILNTSEVDVDKLAKIESTNS